MTTPNKALRLLLITATLTTASLPWGIGPTPLAHADEPPSPLPRECGGSTGPGGTCCVYGYIYNDDAPIAGASVHIESSNGALNATTTSGGASSDPYYSADLSSAPLLVSPGDVITITGSYSDMVSARTWTVQDDGQQVDLGLVAGYQAPEPLLAPTKADAAIPVTADDLLSRTSQPTLAPTQSAATVTDAQNVELVGHIGGTTEAVFVQGNYAYIGVGPRLTILDISDPYTPTLVGQTSPLPNIPQGIYVSGNYAYVAAGEAGLLVVDVSHPATPAEVGSYDTVGEAKGVVVSGTLAYLAYYDRGLRVLDVSTPNTPVHVGFYDTSGEALDVAVAGNYVCVADGSGGLDIIDVSDPEHPHEAGFCDTPLPAQGVAVVGDYAYVVGHYTDSPDTRGGLWVTDVSTPTIPQCNVGSYEPARVYDVAVAGGHAYMTGYGGPVNGAILRVVDVADPADPVEVGSYNVPDIGGDMPAVAVAGPYAYIAGGSSGLRVLDISTPVSPTRAGFYDPPGYANEVVVRENYAYVADYPAYDDVDQSVHGSLRVASVVNPTVPAEVGFYNAEGQAYDVAVLGTYAYLVAGGALRVVSVYYPDDPGEAGFYITPGPAYGVAVSGTYVYVADGNSGLRVVDVSEPDYPEEVGFTDQVGDAKDVAVVGNYAYVAGGNSGLQIVDISTPISPTKVGSCSTSGSAVDVAVSGNYAYVAASSGGLRIVDVTTPITPTQVGFYDTPGFAQAVAVSGDYVYVADGYEGLWVINVSTPTNPTQVGFYDMPGEAKGVAVVEGYVFIANNGGGFYILYHSGGESTPPTQVTISGPTMGNVNTAYAFTANVSPITVTTPITYVWQATGQSPVTHTNNHSDAAMFTWSTTGTQVITATATNAVGMVSDTHVITIFTYAPPNAAFAAAPLAGTVPLTVTFTNQSSGDIISWDWTFGDGNVSGARHPGHEYADPSIYTVSLTVSGPGGSDTESKTDYITALPAILPTWSFLLYLDGDNNLDYWFGRALDRLEAASANPHVVILVQFDGLRDGDTWRYKIQPGVDYSWYLGELDMDDPQTLSDFITWARGMYPTDHTYLAVADHGRGTTGIAWDDTSGSDSFITVAELRTALQSATDGTEPLDVVHYDACLMAMIEDAYQIKDYADYLVASENLGWSVFAYDAYAAQITADTTPEILATIVVSEYHDALTGYPRTISALNLGEAITVTNAISALATSLQNVLNTSIYHVENARTAAQKFDSRDYYVINNDDEYLDLYDLTRLLQQYVDDVGVDLAAQQVMDAVAAFVVAERHESGYYRHYPYWNLDDAHGVSIYFPKELGGWGYDDYVSDISFRFTIDGEWDEFLQDYYGVLGVPPEEPDDPGRPPVLELPHKIYLPIVLRQ